MIHRSLTAVFLIATLISSPLRAQETATAPTAVSAPGTGDSPEVQNISADPRAQMINELSTENEEGPVNIGLVIDSSGSMGQILEKNKTKMFFMKKLLKSFVSQQWKLENKIGVRVYGAREKQSCDDIELKIPYSDHSLARLEKSLETMSPVGMTPLHKSLQMSIDEIAKLEGPKKIVIITDGEDTCAGDPCKSAEKVKKDKLDITFYVVALGFKGASKELEKMKCLGDVHDAKDGDSFSGAMKDISGKVSRGPRDNLKVISPNPDALVYLYRVEGDKRVLDRAFSASQPQSLVPGRYEVVVALQPLYKFDAFTITPGRKVTLKVVGEGQVKVNFFGGYARAQLLDKNNKVVLKFKSDQDVAAPIGKWKLRIFRDPFFEMIIPEYYVYPNGRHAYDLTGVGVVRVESPELKGLYVYDQDQSLLGHSLTGSPFLLKTGMYSLHVDQSCTFGRQQVRERKEVLVLPCPNKSQ